MNRQVLIVDDDPVSLLLLRHMLEANGFTVVEATGVSAACGVLMDAEPHQIDIIVSDYLMADGTGLDLFGAVMAEERFAAVPFVLLTGVALIDEIDDPRADSVTAFVTKPISSSELMDVVNGLELRWVAA